MVSLSVATALALFALVTSTSAKHGLQPLYTKHVEHHARPFGKKQPGHHPGLVSNHERSVARQTHGHIAGSDASTPGEEHKGHKGHKHHKGHKAKKHKQTHDSGSTKPKVRASATDAKLVAAAVVVSSAPAAGPATSAARSESSSLSGASAVSASPSSTTPANDPGSTASLSSLAQDSLTAHNDLRAKHGAPALTWSTELATAAQAWADRCVFEHGDGKTLGSGENLAAYSGTTSNVPYAISLWTDEEKLYDYNNPGFSSTTGHFTQQVWKATTQVGCAQTYCNPIAQPGSSSSWSGYLFVCEYLSAGNVQGAFKGNVLP